MHYLQKNRRMNKPRFRHILKYTAAAATVAAICFGCASVGTPDGGPYDETPPRFLGSTPERNGLNVEKKEVTLEFDEYIKLEKANEKVIISPPQTEQPEISVNGKKIQVKLFDTLQANTTYTIDFSDGIVDNNEGNPLGDFCFNFSTGEQLDTLEVSGYVLQADNLEPVAGIQVGLHSNLEDSAFTTTPFERVSKTDALGHFVIRGIAPGKYRIFALQDMDQNFFFSQKSEMIAWYDSLIIPTHEARFRTDTVFTAEGKVDSLLTVPYTRFMPDDIVMLAFTEDPIQQYMTSSERPSHEKMVITFAIPQDSLPELHGLNFDEKDAYIVEHSIGNDTITYWMKDSLVYYQDTLAFEYTYMKSDTNMVLQRMTDTLRLSPKKTRAKIVQEALKKSQEEAKERDKELKRLEKQNDTLGIQRLLTPKTKFLQVSSNTNGTMDVNTIISFSFKEPIVTFQDTAIHIIHEVNDSTKESMPFILEQDSIDIKRYFLYAEWRPEESYEIRIDSAAIQGLYGLHADKFLQKVKFKALDQYSTFTVNVAQPKTTYMVEILASADKIVRRSYVGKDGSADFFFMKPGKYYVRMFDDINMNGKWDNGLYEEGLKAEPVYYMNKQFELKANWDHETEKWDVRSVPIAQQKPDGLKKAKKEEKKKKSKNAERDKAMAEREAKKLGNKKKSQEN